MPLHIPALILLNTILKVLVYILYFILLIINTLRNIYDLNILSYYS
jgi:hypothetical protein